MAANSTDLAARKVAGRLITIFSDNELAKLVSQVRGESVHSDSSSAALTDKLIGAPAGVMTLLTNLSFLERLSEKTLAISNAIVDVVSALPKSSLEAIASEKGIKVTPNSTSKAIATDLSRALSGEVMIRDIVLPSLSSKSRKEAQPESIRVAKSFKQSLSNPLKRVAADSEKIRATVEDLSKVAKSMSLELQRTREQLSIPDSIDLPRYITAIRSLGRESTLPVAAKDLEALFGNLRQSAGMNSKEVLYASLAYLAAHYSLNSIKSLEWDPSPTEFYSVLRKAFEDVKIIGNRAEIPALRALVCSMLGIDKSKFDRLLTRAWKASSVSLETGSPVGEYDVEYLKADGRKFYYVKLTE